MVNEYISKADVVRTCGGYGELARIMSRLPSADVVKVIRCQNCKHHSYDVAFSCYWCEYPGRVRETTADGFCEKGEE